MGSWADAIAGATSTAQVSVPMRMHDICEETGQHLEEVKEVAGELGLGFLGLGFTPLWTRAEVPIMIVDERLVVEAKATQELHKSASRQVYNYLRVTRLQVGLLLHFGPEPSFHRITCAQSGSPESGTHREQRTRNR